MIGSYRVLERLGAGGMGEVWLAEHVALGRRAAIKMLRPELSSRADIVARLFNEARAAAAIHDPGIVQIFDVGQHDDGRAYIVMELLEGEPLDRRLARRGVLAIGEAVHLVRQIAISLAAAHACGIVHRDLKPENLFIVRDPEVPGGERAKILDFGIAKLAGSAGVKTQTATMIGTPTYMSPEQCRGAGHVDHRSDIYSLGCVLFELVTGRPPFVADGAGELIALQLREPAPRASSIASEVPEQLDEIIARCLAKPPERRPGSASSLAEELASVPTVVAAKAPRATRSSPPHAMPTTLSSVAMEVAAPPRRRRWVFGAVVTATLGSALTFALVRTHPTAAVSKPDAAPVVVAVPAPPPERVDDRATKIIERVLATVTAWSAQPPSTPAPPPPTPEPAPAPARPRPHKPRPASATPTVDCLSQRC